VLWLADDLDTVVLTIKPEIEGLGAMFTQPYSLLLDMRRQSPCLGVGDSEDVKVSISQARERMVAGRIGATADVWILGHGRVRLRTIR
jgi:hypothetical protein